MGQLRQPPDNTPAPDTSAPDTSAPDETRGENPDGQGGSTDGGLAATTGDRSDPGLASLPHKVGAVHSRSHRHRDVQGGVARASVFGVSDGLVSNSSLILGVAGASAEAGFVRLAGIAGLLAGAVSMAAGEYVSMRAQRELFERELELERLELTHNPELELAELVALYRSRGLTEQTANDAARQMMASPEQALEVHAREELGVAPDSLGSPVGAALGSFASFCVGAFIPLLPWFFLAGSTAVLLSLGLALVAAAAVGVILAAFTGRSAIYAAGRQVLIAAGAAGITYAVGSLIGVGVT
jgi:VIT1/CCC1 family predicted Fe2+/Mn2+ transporter